MEAADPGPLLLGCHFRLTWVLCPSTSVHLAHPQPLTARLSETPVWGQHRLRVWSSPVLSHCQEGECDQPILRTHTTPEDAELLPREVLKDDAVLTSLLPPHPPLPLHRHTHSTCCPPFHFRKPQARTPGRRPAQLRASRTLPALGACPGGAQGRPRKPGLEGLRRGVGASINMTWGRRALTHLI